MHQLSAMGEWENVYRTSSHRRLPWYSGRPARSLVRLLRSGIVQKGRALDVCCGDGSNAVYLAGKGFDVTGIDISPTAIGYAMELAERRGVACKFIVGSVLEPLFGEDTFDLVFDRGCYHHLSRAEKGRFASMLGSILKPGGIYHLLCFSDKDGYFGNGVSKEELLANFSAAFEIRSIKASGHREPGGTRRHFYSVVMKKR